MTQDVRDTRWISLVYELLDAHADTARLAVGLDSQTEWMAHLEYLRRLQRVGREALATVGAQEHA